MASAFITVLPSVTWPSPPIATIPLCRTVKIVVERIFMAFPGGGIGKCGGSWIESMDQVDVASGGRQVGRLARARFVPSHRAIKFTNRGDAGRGRGRRSAWAAT